MYQELYELRDFGQGYPVLGSWIVDGHAAGMGIREDGLITGNRARFVPHVISG
jgi:glutathionylspermidine synthase